MEDNGKYLRLFGTIFFTFIGFVLFCILLLLGLRFFFGVLNYIPKISYAFTLFIISVPAAIFVSVFIIFFKRTRTHPSAGARIVSYVLFSIALLAWAYVFIADLLVFFKYYYTGIADYNSYNLAFLSANVFCIFLVGIIQALSLPKKQDWLERRGEKGQ